MKNYGGTGLKISWWVKSGEKSQGSFKAKFVFEDVAPDFIVQIKRILKVLTNQKRIELKIVSIERSCFKLFTPTVLPQSVQFRPHPALRGLKLRRVFLLFAYNNCIQRRHQYRAASQFSHNALYWRAILIAGIVRISLFEDIMAVESWLKRPWWDTIDWINHCSRILAGGIMI